MLSLLSDVSVSILSKHESDKKFQALVDKILINEISKKK